MTAPLRVLVTGADQHQGLAVIRGLGMAGDFVIAAGSERDSLGFASRHTQIRRLYTSPFTDPERCTTDLLRIIRETAPDVVLPSVEATVVLLNRVRDRIPSDVVLALPGPEALECALDKGRTLELARRCAVPAPRTARGDDLEGLLQAAETLRFPVAIKPRGNPLHPGTAHSLGFKAHYARTLGELATRLLPYLPDVKSLLVQEYAPGVGRCVATVCDAGEPLALFAYARDREVPLTGGVSVMRRSIPLDPVLERHVRTLLGALRWHGIAMVEFKYDPASDLYVLMEINGRFQASTALSLDAGLNLPHLVAALFARRPLVPATSYRVGVRERWLRGDLLALAGAWRRNHNGTSSVAAAPRSALGATWDFVRDFRPGMHYDEFKSDDRGPGRAELRAFLRAVREWCYARAAAVWRRARSVPRASKASSAATHRSIRA